MEKLSKITEVAETERGEVESIAEHNDVPSGEISHGSFVESAGNHQEINFEEKNSLASKYIVNPFRVKINITKRLYAVIGSNNIVKGRVRYR